VTEGAAGGRLGGHIAHELHQIGVLRWRLGVGAFDAVDDGRKGDVAGNGVAALIVQFAHGGADLVVFIGGDIFLEEVDKARIALKDAEIVEAGRNIDALAADLSSAHNSLIALQETLSKKDLELEAERRASADLTWQIDRAREGFAVKEAEIEAARGNIDALAADIERARQAHAARDNTEAGLHGEIAALRGELGVLREENAALRGSRWFRIGRMIGLLDRKRT